MKHTTTLRSWGKALALMVLSCIFLTTTTAFLMHQSHKPPATRGQNPGAFKMPGQMIYFAENKGQLIDLDNKKQNGIKYYGHLKGVRFFCKPGMISFEFSKIKKPATVLSEATGNMPEDADAQAITEFNRLDLVFNHSNLASSISASDRQDYYENYYTPGITDDSKARVNTYKKVVYKDIYPQIDLILQARENDMEYSFLVHPGGHVPDIDMSWNGLDKQEFTSTGSRYCTTLGAIEEGLPQSFAGGKKIKTSFTVKKGHRGFSVAAYPKGSDLLIDPTLGATYFGGSSSTNSEEAHGICSDGSAEVYMTGQTPSSSGIATTGAFKTTIGGTTDAFIACFNYSGSIAWATYFGGSNIDIGYGICLDGAGGLYISGKTTSTGANIYTSGGYQTAFGGSFDGFIDKFTTSGSRTWGTFFGGTANDCILGLASDGSNVYFTGYTKSTSGIATAGTYQTAAGGSNSFDIIAGSFSASGSINWASYLGGTSSDIGCGVGYDASGNVFVSGITFSSGLASGGAYQTSNAGNGDFIVAKFTNTGGLSWSTYFGSTGTENSSAENGSTIGSGANGLAVDASGNVYIAGYCDGSGLGTSGTYQSAYGGGSFDGILAKFSGSGNLSWCSYFGGSGSDLIDGLAVDASGNPYICGSSGSSSGIATSGSYQTALSGATDAFIAKFDASGGLTLGSYFGDNSTIANTICADNSTGGFIAGYTTASSNVATSGAYQTAMGGGTYDAFLARFNVYGSGPGSYVVLPVTFTSFTGRYEQNHTLLKWSTAAEVNNDYFAIERSEDGSHFREIGKVPGAGNSKEMKSYSYTDNEMIYGTAYYRLRQTDYNGATHYSNLISVKPEVPLSFSINPNPVTGRRIAFTADMKLPQNGAVQLWNTDGKMVQAQTIENRNSMDLNGTVKPGIYYLKLLSPAGETLAVKKILVE